MSQLLFATAHVSRLAAEDSLPARFKHLLETADFGAKFSGKRVAIKMHVGGGIGFYTLHPLFVKLVVDAVKAAGGQPFLVDGSFSTDAAVVRGYTPEVVGARVVGAGGEHDRYVYSRATNVPGLPEIELCGNITDADALLVFSHGKGHGWCGFGGAIKNIAMGCVSCKTRGSTAWSASILPGTRSCAPTAGSASAAAPPAPWPSTRRIASASTPTTAATACTASLPARCTP
jgi:uncharacterized Fe-S center protein